MTIRLEPDKILSRRDIGDDVNLRFRYQATYGAILALGILNDVTPFEEIFCEHHEDILIKGQDGKFIGVQVKTKSEGLEQLKANNDVVLSAINKFVLLDKEFPDKFSKFVLATNQPFWSQKKNNANLKHVLSLRDATGENAFTKYAKKISKDLSPSSISLEDATNTLLKLELNDDLPKLNDISLTLVAELGKIEEYGKLAHFNLQELSTNLVHFMLDAGSKNIENPKRRYFAYLDNPNESIQDAIIENKRVTKEKIKGILAKVPNDISYLTTWSDDSLKTLAKGYKILELKMGAGKISVFDVNLAKDHKASTELLLSKWLMKYSFTNADERYKHLKTIVRTACQEVYTEKKVDAEFFGEKMLIEVRQRIKEIYGKEKDILFGVQYEQLSGFVGILTEECTVWWSQEFDIPKWE